MMLAPETLDVQASWKADIFPSRESNTKFSIPSRHERIWACRRSVTTQAPRLRRFVPKATRSRAYLSRSANARDCDMPDKTGHLPQAADSFLSRRDTIDRGGSSQSTTSTDAHACSSARIKAAWLPRTSLSLLNRQRYLTEGGSLRIDAIENAMSGHNRLSQEKWAWAN